MNPTKLALLAAVGLAVAVPPTYAQSDLCLPEARGVPFTGGAAPNFWDPGLPPTYIPEDDPGWVGATQTGHGFAASHAVVRGIQDGGTELFFSFHSMIALDPAFPQAELWLGFDDGANTRVYRIRVPHTSPTALTADPIRCLYVDPSDPTPPAHCTDNADRSYRVLVAASGSNPQQGLLDDETHATVTTQWPFETGRVWTRPPDATDPDGDFAIFLRVQVADLGVSAASGTVKMWYQLTLLDSGGGVEVPVAKWPQSADDANFNASFGLLAPAVAQWGTMRIGDGDPSCRPGIFVDRSNVGVAHGAAGGALTSQIVGQDSGADVANFFVARPEHSGGDPLPASGLEARFRVADWGSSPPSAPGAWTSVHELINAAGGTATEWVPISSGQLASGPWTLTSAQRCEYNIPVAVTDDGCAGTATKDDHQCILTELRDSGAGVPIGRDSVYRNTNFVNLSSFERVATIGAQGIDLESDVDYYLYVDARGMPGDYPQPTDPRAEVQQRLEAVAARIEGRYSPPEREARRLREAAANGNDRAAEQLARLTEEARGKMPARTKARLAAVKAALAANDLLQAVADLDIETIEEVMPSMIVYVFRDSGREVDRDGKKVKFFQSQGAFGYYARHAGAVAGWRSVIDGARRLGNSNWYKIAVPAGGTKKINTRIQARSGSEKPIEPDPKWTPRKPDDDNDNGGDGDGDGDGDEIGPPLWKKYWWVLILLLVLILGVGFLASKSKKS